MPTKEFISIDFWTALFTLGNFLLVFFVGKKFLYGPIMKLIRERQQEIDDLYDDAGKAKAEAASLRDEYQAKLTDAQAESERIVKEAVARGQAREEEIIRKANRDAAAIMDKASQDIAQEKKKALNDAKNEIADISLAIAGKVVGRELKAEDQSQLIDGFIDALGDAL